MALTEIQDREFLDAIIDMDHKRFFRCKFKTCTLRYTGGQCEWDKNTSFDRCTWEFLDAAQRTIKIFVLGTSGSFSMRNRKFSTH